MQRTLGIKRAMTTPPARPGAVVSVGFVATASALLMSLIVADATAQTLSNPNAPAKWSAPQSGAKSSDTKSHTTAQTKKSCKEFGAGFVNVPGTDTCVKVGGFVTVEGGTRGR